MKRLLGIAVLTTLSAALLPLSAAAQSRVDVYIGDPAPRVYERHVERRYDDRRYHDQRYDDQRYYGQRYYDQRYQHGYYAPSTRYSRDYYSHAPRGWEGRRGRRDLDRDGIPDRYDRDLDNDGVPNRYDRDVDGDGVRNSRDDRPDNPYRY